MFLSTSVYIIGASENHPLPRRVVEGEIQHEGTISVHKDSTREGAKGNSLDQLTKKFTCFFPIPSNKASMALLFLVFSQVNYYQEMQKRQT